MSIIDPLTAHILYRAEKKINSLIDNLGLFDKFLASTQVKQGVSTIRITSPTKDTIELFKIIRLEMRDRPSITETIEALDSVASLNLPNCTKLAASLASDRNESHTLDVFAAKAVNYLQDYKRSWMILEPLPALSKEDLSSMEAEHYLHNRNLQAILKPVASTTVYEDVPLYTTLARLVPKQIPFPKTYSSWLSPTTGSLLQFSLSHFGAIPWHPSQSQPTTASCGRRLSFTENEQSFEESRNLSEDEDLADRDRLRDNVLSYLQKIAQSRTPADEVSFEKICQRMLKVCSRSEDVISILADGFHLGICNSDL